MKDYQRLIRFAVVGLSGTILDIGVYNVLISFLNVPFQYAQVFSFTAGLLNNFHWNRVWTYPEFRNAPIFAQLPKFTLFSIIGLFIRSGIILVLHPITLNIFVNFPLNSGVLTPSFLSQNFSLGVAIIIVLFWNFISNRLWTFRPNNRV